MKKILLTSLLVITILSCSKDDNSPEPVRNYMKVITLSSGSAPGQPTQYFVEYGTGQDDKVYTEISQQVFEYYENLSLQSPNPRWRGEVTN